MEACDIFREASFQSHNGHWDNTMRGGKGCLECIRAKEMREKGDSILANLPDSAAKMQAVLDAFYTVEAWKEYFKELFGEIEVLETPNGPVSRYKSFSKYTVDEMRKFMDAMNHYCGSELEIFLPLPGVDDGTV